MIAKMYPDLLRGGRCVTGWIPTTCCSRTSAAGSASPGTRTGPGRPADPRLRQQPRHRGPREQWPTTHRRRPRSRRRRRRLRNDRRRRSRRPRRPRRPPDRRRRKRRRPPGRRPPRRHPTAAGRYQPKAPQAPSTKQDGRTHDRRHWTTAVGAGARRPDRTVYNPSSAKLSPTPAAGPWSWPAGKPWPDRGCGRSSAPLLRCRHRGRGRFRRDRRERPQPLRRRCLRALRRLRRGRRGRRGTGRPGHRRSGIRPRPPAGSPPTSPGWRRPAPAVLGLSSAPRATAGSSPRRWPARRACPTGQLHLRPRPRRARRLLQGPADSLVGSGVRLLIVRPGFVVGRMTEGMKAQPFATTPDAVATAAVHGIESGASAVQYVRLPPSGGRAPRPCASSRPALGGGASWLISRHDPR